MSSETDTRTAVQIYEDYRDDYGKYDKYITNKNIFSMPYAVEELNKTVNENYILLIVWFIITLFILLITTLTILDETSMNKYGLYLIIIFIFYIFFNFTNSIFKII
jgi:hypothetical protein